MEENKNNNGYKYLMTVIVTALITCVLTTIMVYNYFKVRTGEDGNDNVIGSFLNKVVIALSDKNDQEELRSSNINVKLAEIKNRLEDMYIGEIDEEKMIEGVLEGYVAALGDEYTEYLTQEEVTELMQDVNGEYVGVGVYIAQNDKTNEIIVVGVIEDSPAYKAGILAGDIIKKVDGKEYTAEELTTASNKMKGIEGTNVKVTILRDGEEKELDIKREKIKFKYVSSEKLENNIGYIRISSFEGECSKEFKNAYNDLKAQGIDSLIIDLRNNGGGLVSQSLAIADMIVPNGAKTLITVDKKGKEEISYSKGEPIVDVPIVILVNEYTASASEILTAAIKENVDCKVVGTTTYGKGIIQGIFLFNDQKTGLKITMQEYFTPNHNKLHKIGIEPDETVELPEEWKGHVTVEKEFDTQLNRAIEILK